MGSANRFLIVFGQGREQGLAHHLLSVVLDTLSSLDVEYRVHDLLGDGFDPVLRLQNGQPSAEAVESSSEPLVARYQADVLWATRLVFIHPVWWFAPPAILKGWIDRVLAGGVALDHGVEPPLGLLQDRRALVLQTFKATKAVERWAMGGISRKFWTRAVFPSVGIQNFTVLGLHGAQAPWGKRLTTFERRVHEALVSLESSTN